MALAAGLGALMTWSAGCSDGQPWNPWARPAAPAPVGPTVQPPGAGQAGPAPAPPSIPKPPPGAGDTTYTILLRMFDDPLSHVEDSDYYQKALTEKLGWKDVFVVHQGGRSQLFRGRYRNVEEAQPNLKTAKAHRTLTGESPFPQALVVPMPGEDVGPAEWNLKHCKGEFSLLVAVFQDDPARKYVGRKGFAVDYCKRLRDGGYEAYFYHGPSNSSVTIGAFPASAVSIRPGPQGEQVTYNDPKIQALQRDFPLLQFNGAGINDVARDQGKEVRIPRQTHLIRVPKLESANAP